MTPSVRALPDQWRKEASSLLAIAMDNEQHPKLHRECTDAAEVYSECADELAASLSTQQEGLIAAAQLVVDTFTRDQEQGYQSKDRAFAIEILSAALRGET